MSQQFTAESGGQEPDKEKRPPLYIREFYQVLEECKFDPHASASEQAPQQAQSFTGAVMFVPVSWYNQVIAEIQRIAHLLEISRSRLDAQAERVDRVERDCERLSSTAFETDNRLTELEYQARAGWFTRLRVAVKSWWWLTQTKK